MSKTLRLILGDQLNTQHSWFKQKDPNILYVLMEMKQETDYVMHHVQKVTAFFAAMRNFSDFLKNEGHEVLYLKLDDKRNSQKLGENLSWIFQAHGISKFEYQLPDEYRLDTQFKEICQELSIPSEFFDTEHFLTDRSFLAKFFKGKKTYLMESFYRAIRKKYGLLMDGNEPVTGKWNYDHENRQKLKDPILLKPAKIYSHQVSEITKMVDEKEVKTFGEIEPDAFPWPINREESLEVLEYFCDALLPNFGKYQDAMYSGDPFLFHSRLSFSLNTKMLSPLEVVKRVEEAWKDNPERYEIAQVEGFIRQIIGWREYMRGVYWAKMPEYGEMNFFGHDRKLPEWYWTGKTQMNCLKHAVGQSLKHAYAHHIQRLMVTGNFALLAGIDPDEVDAWYLGIYIDAIEWVEITNTRGMSQFADGGIVGTKPYVSSANYIDKMGDYCTGCAYNKTQKTGEGACPFNSLYWHFYHRNREKLEKNPRIGMMYRTWDKMKDKAAILNQAEEYMENLDRL